MPAGLRRRGRTQPRLGRDRRVHPELLRQVAGYGHLRPAARAAVAQLLRGKVSVAAGKSGATGRWQMWLAGGKRTRALAQEVQNGVRPWNPACSTSAPQLSARKRTTAMCPAWQAV